MMDTSRVKKFLKDMEDDRIRNDYIAAVDAHVTGLLDSVRGGRDKKRKGKRSASSQIAETREKIDITTPDSIFGNINLKDIINKSTFNALPLFYQYKLVQMLPKCDQVTSTEGWTKISSTALINEFFNRAVKSWSDRLKDGKLTPEFLIRWRNEILKESSKVDPWKAKHFERVWGESLESQTDSEAGNEFDRIPKSSLYEQNGQQNEFSRSSSSSSNIDDEPLLSSVLTDEIMRNSATSSLNNQINSILSLGNLRTSNLSTSEIGSNDDSKQHVLKSILKKPKSPNNKIYHDKNLYGINDSLEEENNVITEEATVPSITETSDVSIEGMSFSDKRLIIDNLIGEPLTTLNNSGSITITPIEVDPIISLKSCSIKDSNFDISDSLEVPAKKVRIVESKNDQADTQSVKMPRVQTVSLPCVKRKLLDNLSDCLMKSTSSNPETNNSSKKKPSKKRSSLLDGSLDAIMDEELPSSSYSMTQSAVGQLFLFQNHIKSQNLPNCSKIDDTSSSSSQSLKTSFSADSKETNLNGKNDRKINQGINDNNTGTLHPSIQNDGSLSLITRRKLAKLSSSITLEPICNDTSKPIVSSNNGSIGHKSDALEDMETDLNASSSSFTSNYNSLNIESNGLRIPYKLPDSITVLPYTDSPNNFTNSNNNNEIPVSSAHQTTNPGSSSQRPILFLSNRLNISRRISDEINNKKDYSVDFSKQMNSFCDDIPRLPPHITVIPLGPRPINSSNIFPSSVATSNSPVKVNNNTNNSNNNNLVIGNSNNFTITINTVNQTYGIQSNFAPTLASISPQAINSPVSLTSMAANQVSPNRINCDCNLKALVVCTKCRAFCHNDCVGPIQLCITCLVR